MTLNSSEGYIPFGGELEKGNENKKARFSAPNIALTADGSTKRATLAGYNIDDNNYFKLRDIAQIFDFNIEYDGHNGNVIIDTASGYAPNMSVLTRPSNEKIGMAFESDINLRIDDVPMVSYYTNDDTGYSEEQLELLRNNPVLRGVYIDVRELRNYGFDVAEDNGRIDVERIPFELPKMMDTEIINSAPSKVYDLYADSTEVYVFGNRTACVKAGDMILIPITALEKYISVSSGLYNSISAGIFHQEIYTEYDADKSDEKQYTPNEISAVEREMPYNWIDRFYEKPDINMIRFIGSTCNYTGYGDKEHLRNGKGISAYGPAPVEYEHGIYEDNKLIEGIHRSPMQRRLGRKGSVRERSGNYERDSFILLEDNPKFRFNSRVFREGEIDNDGKYCGKFKAYDENGELIFDGDYADYEKQNMKQ